MSGSLDLSVAERASLFDALRQAAERSGTGLAITDISEAQPRNLFVSTDLARMMGYEPHEVVGKSPWEMIAPDEVPRLQQMMAQRQQGQKLPGTFETVLLHRSGARIAIELAQSRTMLDGHPVTVTFVNDISSRAATSQALRESEKRFRDLVDGAPDGVAILRGPIVMFLNARAAKLLGLSSPAQGTGRMITEFLHPDDRERAATRIKKLLKEGGLDERAEYRSLDGRGEERAVEISSIPIEYQGGPAVLAFARDVTERKRMETKLLEADRLTALGVLSAGVAHEINNPLAYVLLNLEYLKRELPKAASDPSRIESLMVRVQDACHGADRVAAIVRDLRTFARGEETARQPVSLESVIESAVNIAYPEIRTRARLERRYQTVPAVDGNAGRLEQVFMNLLLNAAQAFPEDSDESQNSIRVSLRAEGDHVIAEVADNGPGIPPELLTRIFDPFFTTKPVGVGTGLGLPICRGIVQTHSGEITVDSKPFAGAVFTVSLPASKLSPIMPRKSDRSPQESPDGRERGRVLVVDDESVVAHTLKVLLQGEHDLVVAQSGAEALELLQQENDAPAYDAILCDLMMPGMTGMELFEVLRREYPALAKRVIFMTGGVSMLRVSEFLESVPNAKFEKPFDVAELRRTLHGLVAKSRGNAPSSPPQARV
ncbi:MAG TPA: PAS domain S-box protein [Polyangiaceae bacterium]|nr:PAS domain S-box protein [Polyangiaceae bacterium]